jgi:hypothetical protein
MVAVWPGSLNCILPTTNKYSAVQRYKKLQKSVSVLLGTLVFFKLFFLLNITLFDIFQRHLRQFYNGEALDFLSQT